MSPTSVIIGVGGIVLLLGVVIFLYNNLVFKRNSVAAALSSVDVMLKKRFDLIPNLVRTVKGYMQHEQALLEKLTTIRSQFNTSTVPAEKFIQANVLQQLLGKVFISMEQYPQLKASTNVLELQAQLERAEEDIAAARRAYNASVRVYNDAIQMFPQSIVAAVGRFKTAEMFNDHESGI